MLSAASFIYTKDIKGEERQRKKVSKKKNILTYSYSL